MSLCYSRMLSISQRLLHQREFWRIRSDSLCHSVFLEHLGGSMGKLLSYSFGISPKPLQRQSIAWVGLESTCRKLLRPAVEWVRGLMQSWRELILQLQTKLARIVARRQGGWQHHGWNHRSWEARQPWLLKRLSVTFFTACPLLWWYYRLRPNPMQGSC